jgi:hypothetical protein
MVLRADGEDCSVGEWRTLPGRWVNGQPTLSTRQILILSAHPFSFFAEDGVQAPSRRCFRLSSWWKFRWPRLPDSYWVRRDGIIWVCDDVREHKVPRLRSG